MTDGGDVPRAGGARDERSREAALADALRSAVERTMRATAGSAASTRERAAELLDDVVRRGRGARAELSRRGSEAGAELSRRSQEAGAELSRRSQEAGAGLARRGQEATEEVARQLEALERRLARLEARLAESRDEVEGPSASEQDTKPQAED